MLPFQKIITLLIRTMAKPMLTMAKKKHQQKKATYFNTFFILFGRKYHRIQNWINMKIIKSAKDKHTKQLKQQVALEKGIQGLYQIFFYMIVIGLPLHQMYKASLSAQAKQEKLNNQIKGLQDNLDEIQKKIDQLVIRKVHVPIMPVIHTNISHKQQNQSKQTHNQQKQKKSIEPSSSDPNQLKQQKKQVFVNQKQEFAPRPQASQIVAETMQDQIQDSILQAISDFIQEAVVEAIQSV